MLKLKRVQILGFKSFCDRTDVQLSGSGIAAVVGPNGCGKSNIADAITWVLGEQSAKSLRGGSMQDVIFSGTRDRKPTGMAEVSLTLVDPEVYDPHEPISIATAATSIAEASDWDESADRAIATEATEAAVQDAQPGKIRAEDADDDDADAEGATDDSNAVVLKIRRRKFNRAPVRAGEITITRRLFRSGESEYLLNGKICRLRDIQDIFAGTGLSGENYAIIGQERIGQLLSSKPLDRRSIIEEAAGITRFKTKKRLAELRLEASKQNLSRVDDIFEEVTRQMASLKRQAAKAERYGALRDELRAQLRIVLRSRLLQMDAEQTSGNVAIATLTQTVDAHATSLAVLDEEHTSGTARGYALDEELRGLHGRANETRVEQERAASRIASNTDRIADLAARIAGGSQELTQLREQIAALLRDREGLQAFLDTATADTNAAREASMAANAAAAVAAQSLGSADTEIGRGRHNSIQLMNRISGIHRDEAQAAEALSGLDREAARLVAESDGAKRDLDALGRQRGQVSLSFESVTDRLQRLESEIAQLRLTIESHRISELETRRRGDHLRAEAASLTGRRNSIDALIRDHSYSSDTVRNLFSAAGDKLKPLGTLADFLEVDDEYGAAVDNFLREELNYIVVKTWDDAGVGIGLLQGSIDGRATFLVHPEHSPVHSSATAQLLTPNNARPLRDCIRVLNGFGTSLQDALPRLRNGFLAPDGPTAQALATQHADAWFVTPSGETYCNVTVTGGRARAEGPLALKRELREITARLESVQSDLGATDAAAATLTHQIAEAQHTLEARNSERREAERDAANSGAALRQMDSEAARIEKRLSDWSTTSERNRDARAQKQDIIERKQAEAATLTAERETIEARVTELVAHMETLRLDREHAQVAASAAATGLATLEERRRNAASNFEQHDRMQRAAQSRIDQLQVQNTGAREEQERREAENIELVSQRELLNATTTQLTADTTKLAAEGTALRAALAEKDAALRALRADIDTLREQRSTHQANLARLSSELEHVEAQSLNDLGQPPADLRADATITSLEAEALSAADEDTRAMKSRLEAMGPVNMMALEEYDEAATRHGFLETQRKDLMDSIANTQASIKEIDEISRSKFDEAFAVINQNFSDTFVKLFGGGQAYMKLTDEENAAESGIDLIASPPGKKLQNVLLLSGGEKALTALSLLVGIFEHQRSPFCVLDEVDAPLDETNVGRFARLIHEMSRETQFVLITHHKRTMQEADVIYGVTMQEPGVSKIVSVNLNKAERRVA